MRYMAIHLMSMPKTTMDKNNYTIFTQYYIWSARQPFNIFTETVTTRKKVTTY